MTETAGAKGLADTDAGADCGGMLASDLLLRLVPAGGSGDVTVADLVGSLRDRAFALALLVFALPNCIPLPPGLGAVFGFPLALFGLQMLYGYDRPWLPRSLGERRLDRSQVIGVLGRAAAFLRRLEIYARPRLRGVTGRTTERWVGLAVLLFAISIAFPLPLSNFLPALGTAVLALGLLVKDGLAVLVGLLIGAKGLVVTGLVLTYGLMLTASLVG